MDEAEWGQRMRATLREYDYIMSEENAGANLRVILRDALEALKWIYYGPAEGCDAPDIEEAIEAAEAALRLEVEEDEPLF